jgi:hypothetical protein
MSASLVGIEDGNPKIPELPAERFEQAKQVLHAAIVGYQQAVLPYIAHKTRDAFPDATGCWCFGEYNDEGTPVLRLRQVDGPHGVIANVDIAGDQSDRIADLADELDPYLDWLIVLTGEDYLGWNLVSVPEGTVTWVGLDEAEQEMGHG